MLTTQPTKLIPNLVRALKVINLMAGKKISHGYKAPIVVLEAKANCFQVSCNTPQCALRMDIPRDGTQECPATGIDFGDFVRIVKSAKELRLQENTLQGVSFAPKDIPGDNGVNHLLDDSLIIAKGLLVDPALWHMLLDGTSKAKMSPALTHVCLDFLAEDEAAISATDGFILVTAKASLSVTKKDRVMLSQAMCEILCEFPGPWDIYGHNELVTFLSADLCITFPRPKMNYPHVEKVLVVKEAPNSRLFFDAEAWVAGLKEVACAIDKKSRTVTLTPGDSKNLSCVAKDAHLEVSTLLPCSGDLMQGQTLVDSRHLNILLHKAKGNTCLKYVNNDTYYVEREVGPWSVTILSRFQKLRD